MRGCLGINTNKFRMHQYSAKKNEFFTKSKHGELKVWADDEGIYIDIFDKHKGEICIASVHPENYGYSCFVYEDYAKGMPTKETEFKNIGKAFDDYIGFRVM